MKQRKIEAREEAAHEKSIVQKKIYIGNLHELVDSKPGNLPFQQGNCHKWTFFLQSASGDDLSQFVEKVVVNLHPTFHPKKVTLTEEPYMFSRIGWGVFLLHITVHYHDYLQKEKEDFHHMLSWDNINFTIYELELDKRKFPNYVPEIAAISDDEEDEEMES